MPDSPAGSPQQAVTLIAGATASGKSALAMALAERTGGEIVSADSMQVYRGMDIGTAKPSEDEQRAVPHHLIDIREPTEAFSVHEWLGLADACLCSLQERQTPAIVVGGTHLYAKAFLEGLFEGPRVDAALREEIVAMEPGVRRAELERIDPAAAQRIHPNDERRTVRALEVYRQTGTPISELQAQWDTGGHRAGVALVGIVWEREALARRINARVVAMVERGLFEEVRGLWEAGRLGPTACEAVGYKQLIDHFEGRSTRDEAIEQTKITTRRLAKNQRTWLKRLRATPGARWIDGADLQRTIEAGELDCLLG